MKANIRPIAGHILDIDPSELSNDVLSLAKNVDTRAGFPSRIRGRRSAYSPPLPTDPYHLLNFNLNAINWWILFGTSNIYALETTNEYDISIAGQLAITNPYQWQSTLLNGIPVFTNGRNLPQYWNGNTANDALVLPGWPAATTCQSIVAFRFHLFAMNIDGPGGVFENLIMWSEATEPGAIPQSWTPSPDNEAGSAFLADSDGRCIAGSPLGTQLMIYKPASFYAIEYAGQQPDNIFIVRPVVRSTGLLGPNALKTIGNFQAVVGNDDVVLNDGAVVKSIADNRVKRFLATNIDSTNSKNVFTVWDKNKKELWVCAPQPGSQFCTIAHIWDQGRDAWVTRDLTNVRYGTTGYATDTAPAQNWSADAQSWDADISTWNETPPGGAESVLNAESSALYVEDLPEANLVTASIQRLDLTFDDAEQRKVTSRVYVKGLGAGLATLSIRLGARDSLDAGIVWSAFVTRKAEGNEYEVTGKFISVEVMNSDSANPWTVTRITIEAEYDGTF